MKENSTCNEWTLQTEDVRSDLTMMMTLVLGSKWDAQDVFSFWANFHYLAVQRRLLPSDLKLHGLIDLNGPRCPRHSFRIKPSRESRKKGTAFKAQNTSKTIFVWSEEIFQRSRQHQQWKKKVNWKRQEIAPIYDWKIYALLTLLLRRFTRSSQRSRSRNMKRCHLLNVLAIFTRLLIEFVRFCSMTQSKWSWINQSCSKNYRKKFRRIALRAQVSHQNVN